jgi:hypothetical protein
MVERVSFFDARDYGNVEWVMLQHVFNKDKPASASIKASIGHINANGRKDEFKMLVDDIKKQESEVKRAEYALKKERPLASKTPFVYYMPNPNFNFKKDDIVVVYSGRAAVYKYNRTKQVSFSNNVCKVNSVDNGNLNVTTIYGGSEITTQPNHCALLVQYNERKILIYFHEDRSSMSSSSKPMRERSRFSSRISSKKPTMGGKKRKRANHTQRRRR